VGARAKKKTGFKILKALQSKVIVTVCGCLPIPIPTAYRTAISTVPISMTLTYTAMSTTSVVLSILDVTIITELQVSSRVITSTVKVSRPLAMPHAVINETIVSRRQQH
jgi:hypothetical protein